jgi:energy-converting hydrogenase Eha subunit C
MALDTRAEGGRAGALRDVGLILALSFAYEIYFLGSGANPVDEGWPLYAAMRLHRGGTLYDDVFWVFPPLHVLPAWIGYAIDPPGLYLTRVIYSLFNSALCVSLYLLGRRLMAPAFALVAALCVAVAAPNSHEYHLLFGYRYMVFSVLALLAFDRGVRTGEARWMLAAGAWSILGFLFRIDPGVSAAGGIGFAVIPARTSWRTRFRDFGLLAAGGLALLLPAVGWWGSQVGLDRLVTEVWIRPFEMNRLQWLPYPPLHFPRSGGEWRGELAIAFESFLYHLPWLLYGVYAAVLVPRALRAMWRREPFEQALLLAVLIWGGLFFVRSVRRADIAHLDSALPPVCLLTLHLGWLAFVRLRTRFALPPRSARRAEALVCTVAFVFWVFIIGSEVYWRRAGTTYLWTLWDIARGEDPGIRMATDSDVEAIRRLTAPDDVVLDLTCSPVLFPFSDRLGPGHGDTFMPGTFLDAAEEEAYLERLRAAPPRLVLVPLQPFDGMEERSLERTFPRISAWVSEHYRAIGSSDRRLVMVPREHPAESKAE